MLIPLSTDRPSRRPAVITPVLIAINIIAFLVVSALERFNPEQFGGLTIGLALSRENFHPWSVLTSVFTHGGVLHIAFNMVFLWVFGPPVEDRLGRVWFLIFYLLGGAAAGGMHIMLEKSPVIGASGAIAAVSGAFLIMFPLTQIRCLWLFGGSQSWVSAWWFIGFAIIMDFVLKNFSGHTGIAHLAHIGGYLFGAAISFAALALNILPRENYDVFAMVRQAHRRRVIQQAVTERQRDMSQRLDPAAASPEEQAVTQARAEVTRLAGIKDWVGATRAYAAMLASFPHLPISHTTMGRVVQLELANRLLAAENHTAAAAAYERFATQNKNDPETPRVLVMLALVSIRHLRDAPRARSALDLIGERLTNEDERSLAAILESECAATEKIASM